MLEDVISDELGLDPQAANAPASKMNRAPSFLLYWNVLIIACCGLIYELLAGALASYVLGDSVTQFSLVIGVYLFALGAGAWLSRFLKSNLARAFIEVELGVALVGGFSAPILFLAFAHGAWFHGVLFSMVFAVGALVGLELPLLMRLLKSHVDFDDLVSRVLAFDYLGALAASILFPLFLVPHLGLVRTSLTFGLLNALVALAGTYMLRPLLARSPAGLQGRAILVMGLLLAGLVKAESLTRWAEEGQFTHPIVHSRSTPYQRIVFTQGHDDFQLYLNGNLQFHSADEYRYHEALVHPAMALAPAAKRILVLGGGDGLALREILRYPHIEQVTLVDIDPAMTELAASFPLLANLNQHSLLDPRVLVIHEDAFIWLNHLPSQHQPPFDLAIVDFPDPSTFSLGKLYSTRFYRLLREAMAPDAPVALQCTSPLAAPNSYWCIHATIAASGFETRPYQAAVPSFGVWGFTLARRTPFPIPTDISADVQNDLRFLNRPALRSLFEMPPDMNQRIVDINRLDNQALVRYYEAEWKR